MIHHDPSGPESTPSGTKPTGRAAPILVTVIALLCGALAGWMVWKAGVAADRELATHRHQVTATTTERAKAPATTARYGAEPRSTAPAVWEYPDQVGRSGTIQVPPRTPEGHALTIWVDDSGEPARAPGGAGERTFASLSGGIVATGAVAAVGIGALALVRRRTEARSLAAWEREWEVVEPVWSGRLPRGSGPGTGDD
ncbi:Rv1733c family protein [Streptomyces vilmorinianum]|uniref:Rv1733c family protein n=1 Tax=Streptomyces vilmorinianum TaxID=3051092 RepID=UPI0010FB5147|nr:hypothetical protein [Streptomyces vilmorinianum]